MCVRHVCKRAWTLEKNTGFPETRITGGCESPHGYWELSPCSRATSTLHLSQLSGLLPTVLIANSHPSVQTGHQEIFLSPSNPKSVSSSGGLNSLS